MHQFQNNNCSIRQFLPAEVQAYKTMRLEAITKEPGNFGRSLAYELALTDEQWLDRIAHSNSVCFGLWCNDELIGITGVVINKEDNMTGTMVQSYIKREHRGQKLSHYLYTARIQWAKDRGLKRLVIGHKESNLASKNANRHFGFVYTHREPTAWPNGSVEDVLYYHLYL